MAINFEFSIFCFNCLSLSLSSLQLAIANPRWQVIHKLRLANFVGKIGGRVYLTVGEAMDNAAAPDAERATIQA